MKSNTIDQVKYLGKMFQVLGNKNENQRLTVENASEEDLVKINADLAVIVTGFEEESIQLTKEQAEDVSVSLSSLYQEGYYNNAVAALPAEMKSSLTRESAEGGEIEAINLLNRVYNSVPSTQDEFSNTFFPVVPVPAGKTQIDLEIAMIAYYKDWDGTKKSKILMTDLIKDPSFLLGEDTRIWPINENDNMASLYQHGSRELEDGRKTAPYLFDVELPFIKLGTDSAALSASNKFKQISPTVKLEKLYGDNITDEAAHKADPSNSIFTKVDVQNLRTALAGKTPSGRKEEFQINFDVAELHIPLTDFLKHDGSLVFPDSTLIAVYDVKIMGNGNIEHALGELNISKGKLVKIVDAKGEKVSEDNHGDAYAKAGAVNFKGFDLITYENNSDLSKEGNILTEENDSEKLDLEYVKPQSVIGTVADLYGNKDAKKLSSLVSGTGAGQSARAVKKLIDVADESKALYKYNLDLDKTPIQGMGVRMVKPYHKVVQIDIEKAVNNMESTELTKSIQAAIQLAFKTELTLAANDSGLAAAWSANYPGRQLTAGIGTDNTIIQHICDENKSVVSLSKDIKAKMVSTPNIAMKDRIIATFVADNSSEVNELTLGACYQAPTVIAETSKTVNEGTKTCITAHPIYKHQKNINVVVEFELLNLDKVIKGLN